MVLIRVETETDLTVRRDASVTSETIPSDHGGDNFLEVFVATTNRSGG